MNSLNLILNAIVNDTPTTDLNNSITALSNNPQLAKLILKIDIDKAQLDEIAKSIKEFKDAIGNKTKSEDGLKIINVEKLKRDKTEYFKTFDEIMRKISDAGKYNVRIPEKIFDPATRNLESFVAMVDKGNGKIDEMRFNLVNLSKKNESTGEKEIIGQAFVNTNLKEKTPTDSIAQQKKVYDALAESAENLYRIKEKIIKSDGNALASLQKELDKEQERYDVLQNYKIDNDLSNKAQEDALNTAVSRLDEKYETKVSEFDDSSEKKRIAEVNALYDDQEIIIKKIHSLNEKFLKTDEKDLETQRNINEQIEQQLLLHAQNQSKIMDSGIDVEERRLQISQQIRENELKLDAIKSKQSDTADRQAETSMRNQYYAQQESATKRIGQLKVDELKAERAGHIQLQGAIQEEIAYEQDRLEQAQAMIKYLNLQDSAKSSKLDNDAIEYERKITLEKQKQLDLINESNRKEEESKFKNYGNISTEYDYTGSSKEDLSRIADQLRGNSEILSSKFTPGFDKAGKAVNFLTVKIREGTQEAKEWKISALDAEKSVRVLEGSTSKAAIKDYGIGGMIKTAMTKYPIWLAATAVFQKSIEQIKNGIQYIVQMDTALVSLRKVTDLTEKQFDSMKDASISLGKQLGKSSVDIMNSFAEIARVYKNPADIEELSKISIMASNVTSLSAADAAKSINTMLITYKMGVKDAATVLDQLNEIKCVSIYSNVYVKINYIGETLNG